MAVPAGLRSPGADVVRRSRPGIHHRHSRCSRCRHAASWRRRRPGTHTGGEVSRPGTADRVRVSARRQHPRAHCRWLRARRRTTGYGRESSTSISELVSEGPGNGDEDRRRTRRWVQSETQGGPRSSRGALLNAARTIRRMSKPDRRSSHPPRPPVPPLSNSATGHRTRCRSPAGQGYAGYASRISRTRRLMLCLRRTMRATASLRSS